MDTGVGPPGASHFGLVAQDLLQRPAQHTRHRADVGLGGEAMETRPVVGDDELQLRLGGFTCLPRSSARVEERQTSSILAIGALSPGRGPSLRIRRYPPGRSA